MKKDKAIQLAYAAGVIDSDGTICIVKSGNHDGKTYRRLRVAVKMCDGKAIDLLYGIFGGCVRERDGDGYKFSGSNGTRHNQYAWHVQGYRAASVCKKLIPFLRVKKENAEIGVRFYSKKKSGKPINESLEAEMAGEMSKLNHSYHPCAAVETKQGEHQDNCLISPKKKQIEKRNSEIRERLKNGAVGVELAKEYDLHKSYISKIKNCKV